MENVDNRIKKISRDSLFYLIGNIIVGIAGFVAIKLYTKYFTVAENGEYSLIIGTLSLMISILISWLDNSIVRFSDYYINESREEYYSTIIASLSVVNCFVVIVAAIIVFIFKSYFGAMYDLACLAIILFVPQTFSTIFNSMLRALGYPKTYAINNIVVALGKIVIVYILVKAWNVNIQSIFYSMILSYIVTAAISVKKLKVKDYINFSKFNMSIVKEFFKYGTPLLGLALTTWVLSISDRYIINYFQSSVEVGIYSVCYNLAANIFSMINTFIMLSAYPIIIKTWNKDGIKDTEILISKLLKYYLVLVIPMLFGAIALGKPLIILICKKEYLPGYNIFWIVALGIILQGVTDYTNKVWELTKKTSIILYLNLMAAVLNIVLNFIFIPIFGYTVGAITTVVSYGAYLCISIAKSKNKISIKVSNASVIKSIISSILMAITIVIIVRFIHNIYLQIVISLVLGISIYFMMMYLFNELRTEILIISNKVSLRLKLRR